MRFSKAGWSQGGALSENDSRSPSLWGPFWFLPSRTCGIRAEILIRIVGDKDNNYFKPTSLTFAF